MWGEGEGVSAEGSEADQGRDGVAECGKRLIFQPLFINNFYSNTGLIVK